MFPKSKSLTGFISGQSLFEVVLALAIFSLLAAAFISLTLGSVSNVSYGTDFLTAGVLADQGIGAVRAIRDNAWNDLLNGANKVATTSNGWRFAGAGNETFVGRFNRTITLSPVDLQTKSLKVEVTWPSPIGTTQKATRQTYLTNWDSRDWIQTDWSGGQYASIDPTIEVSAVGQISLKAKPLIWNLFPPLSPPITQILNSVACRNANDCWAVGNAITSGPAAQRGEVILRWNGASWTRQAASAGIPDINLNSIFCLPNSDCWAVGASGTILRWNGSAWSSVTTGAQTWNEVFMISLTDGFAVGNSGNIRRWNNPTPNVWNTPTGTPLNARNLNAVSCSSASNCFAVGASGGIIRWNGTIWSLFVTTGAQTWNDVFMISATDGLIVGNGGLTRRWNGTNWTTAPTSGTTQNLSETSCSSASNCFAVGASGTIFRWTGGPNWSLYSPSPTTQTLNAVFLSLPNDGWAVGGTTGSNGTILRLSGGGFENLGSLISLPFDMGDPSPVQIIGWDETVPACSPACTIKLNIKTAATSAGLAGVLWSTDFTVAAGTLIDPSYNGLRWVQYRATLTGDGASTPVLQEVRLNYK